MKALKLTVLAVFTIIWGLGLSSYDKVYPHLYRWGIIDDEYRYGDLFNLSHLPQFKEEMVKCENGLTVPKQSSRPLHLYVLGDSFLEPQRIDSSDFIADRYHFIKWDNYQHFRLDTSATNIVLIESVERHFRQHFETPPSFYFVPDTAGFEEKWREKRWMARLDNFMESGRAEGQLGLLLTGNSPGLKFKELRSRLNFQVFGRSESGVTVSDNGKHIVYYLDTDTLNFPHTSGFSEISGARIDSVVNSLNKTRSELLSMGFDHLLFSVIPNKSTIVMPDYGRYNRLIERVQSHPALEVPYVSVIDEYRALGAGAYLHSDSHWTCDGRTVWLRKVNQELNRLHTISSGPLPAECFTPGSTGKLIKNTLY